MKTFIVRRRTAIHCFIVTAFIIYLLFANHLFGRILTVDGEAQLVQMPSVTAGELVKFNIEKLQITEIKWKEMIEVEGFGFIEGMSSNKDNKFFIILDSSEDKLSFNANPVVRKDVTEHFKNLKLDLDYTGFKASIAQDVVPEGKYKIGLVIKNKDREALTYFHKILVKQDGKVKLQ